MKTNIEYGLAAALIVLAVSAVNGGFPTVIMQLLDQPVVQLLLVGVTIALGLYSRPVAIAALLGLVIVFFSRNVNKVMNASLLKPSMHVPSITSYATDETKMEILSGKAMDPFYREPVPEGSFPLDEDRPRLDPEINEVNFAPFPDTGNNDWLHHGASIDEKLPLPSSSFPSIST